MVSRLVGSLPSCGVRSSARAPTPHPYLATPVPCYTQHPYLATLQPYLVNLTLHPYLATPSTLTLLHHTLTQELAAGHHASAAHPPTSPGRSGRELWASSGLRGSRVSWAAAAVASTLH